MKSTTWIKLGQWCYKHAPLTPMGRKLCDYCESIINGTQEDTIDDYETLIQEMMEDNDTTRYKVALRTLVLLKSMEYADDCPYDFATPCDEEEL